MTILNEASDGTLSVLIALRDTLRAYGPMSEGRLLALCAPTTLTDGKKAAATLRRWTQLGVFVEGEGLIRLSPEVSAERCDDVRFLRPALARIVLRKENTPGFDEAEESEESEEKRAGKSLATDFARAAAWCLLQDPYTSCSTWATVEPLQLSQKGGAFQNAVRWNGFVRWSGFLGFSVTLPGSSPKQAPPILVNPATATWEFLGEVLPVGKARGLGEVLEELAAKLPVLPGGEVSRKVASRIERPWRNFADYEVPPALSLALLQWRFAAKVRLTRPSDAGVRHLLGRNGVKLHEYSTIERLA